MSDITDLDGSGPVVDWDALRAFARDAARAAYAPYSRFRVGAAGLVDDGRVVSGCNVENASYGLTLCAECGMISELHRTGGGSLLAVVASDPDGHLLAPCGRCRQLMFEAGGADCLVNEYCTVGGLLPGAFDLPADQDLPADDAVPANHISD